MHTSEVIIFSRPLQDGYTLEELVRRVDEEWSRVAAGSVYAFAASGDLLNILKWKLKHGEWQSFVNDFLPMKLRTAQRLIAISQDYRILSVLECFSPGSKKRNNALALPCNLNAVYACHRLTDDDFAARLKDGTINGETTVGQLKRLQARVRRKAA